MKNYSPVEFPIFSHDYDYMDIIGNLVQEKLIGLKNSYKKIDIIFEKYDPSLKSIRKTEGNKFIYSL